MGRWLCCLSIIGITCLHLGLTQENEVGKWGEWSPMQRLNDCQCVRVRACFSADGTLQLKNHQCPGDAEQYTTCLSKKCKDWAYSHSETPPEPDRSVRVCPQGNATCQGENVEHLPCYDNHCPSWGGWGPWSRCPVQQRGKRFRTRRCLYPTGSEMCVREDIQEQPCSRKPCPHFKMELRPAQVKFGPDGRTTTFRCRYQSPLKDVVTIQLTTEPHTEGAIYSTLSVATPCGWSIKSDLVLNPGGKFVVCTVKNSRGDVISKMASVILKGDLPTVIVQDRLVSVSEGGNTSLQCRELHNQQVVWTRMDRHPLSAQAKTLPNGDLELRNVQPSDGGEYVCKAENEAGISNQTVVLNVRPKPTKPNITLLPSDFLQKNVNDSVTLECRATAYPNPEVTWTHFVTLDNVTVKIHQQNIIDGTEPRSKLVFPRVNKKNSGIYTCIASNQHSSIEAYLTLVVDDFKDDYPRAPDTTTGPVVLPPSNPIRQSTPTSSTTTTTTTTTTPKTELTSSSVVAALTPSATDPVTDVTSTDQPQDVNTQPNVIDKTIRPFNECPPEHLRCSNMNCVPVSVYCDGQKDCDDAGSDEWNCGLTKKTYPCKRGQFLCRSSYPGFHCIPESFLCDGKKDCGDNSDEDGCNRL